MPLLVKLSGKNVFPISFLVLPGILSFPLLMGFYSYVIGIPLLIMLMIIMWKARTWSLLYRILFINFAGVMLCFCHLLLYVVFVIVHCVFLMITADNLLQKIKTIFQVVIVNVVPMFIVVLYFIKQNQNIWGNKTGLSLFVNYGKRDIQNLMMLSLDSFTIYQGLAAFAVTLTLICLLIFLALQIKSGYVLSDYEKWLLSATLLLSIFYILVPDSIGVLGLIKLRLPVLIVIMLLPVLITPTLIGPRKLTGIIILLVSIASMSVNIYAVAKEADKVESFLVWPMTHKIEKQIVVTYKSDITSRRVDSIKHSISYYCILAKCINAGNYELASNIFSLIYKNDTPPLPPIGMIQTSPSAIHWDHFKQIKYVFGWRLREHDRAILQNTFKLVWQNDRLSVWCRT